MKLECGKRWRAKFQWHRWYAWHPVKIIEGDCRWLEYVWRRKTYPEHYFDDYKWEYRLHVPQEAA